MDDKVEMLKIWSRVWRSATDILLKKAVELKMATQWRKTHLDFLKSNEAFVSKAMLACGEALLVEPSKAYMNHWGYVYKVKGDIVQASLSAALNVVIGAVVVWDYDETFPLAAVLVLFKQGVVPSFDGEKWRLHDRVTGEIKGEADASALGY
jgi:hypothetical protein